MPDRVACVGALVSDARGRLLLVLRAHPPQAGHWSLPGGRVEAGESSEQAIVREVAEETGLVVVPERMVGRVLRHGPGGVEYDVADFRCRWHGGQLRAGDDAREARFVTADELAVLALTTGLYDVLREWGELPRNAP